MIGDDRREIAPGVLENREQRLARLAGDRISKAVADGRVDGRSPTEIRESVERIVYRLLIDEPA